MDSVRRFDDRVANYDRYRPGYPDAVAGVLAEYGLRAPADIADIGAGTGKLAEVFVRAGHRVTLIEPGDAMRAVAERNFGGGSVAAASGSGAHERPARGRAVVRAGTAEATGLPAASADAIIAGQAFHWFEPRATRTEWLRVLRPGGVVALAWNDRRRQDSPLLEEYERLLLRYCGEYARLGLAAVDEAGVLAFLGGGSGAARGASASGAAPRISTFPNAQDLDWAGFEGRVLSASYVPLAGPAHDALLSELRAAFERHAVHGRVLLPYDTRVFHGRLA